MNIEWLYSTSVTLQNSGIVKFEQKELFGKVKTYDEYLGCMN